MEESFKPLSLTINQLFGDTGCLYKIPRYQRPYKWKNEQVEQLWDDIYDSFQNSTCNYFLGSIITAKPIDEDKSIYVDVVDGQQRLTTLMILFCVIRDNYPHINQNTEDPFAIDIDALKSAILLNNKANRLKLYTQAAHQSDFESFVLNEGATKALEPPYRYQIQNDQEPKYKFINTAVIFKERLERLTDTERNDFLNYLFSQVRIIRIDCSSKDFAIKLFQVLNNRGMDLTSADLIKSFLIEKLYSKYKEDENKAHLKLQEERFINDWQAMENVVKQCDDLNLNDLFVIYEYYLLAANPKKSLTEELQSLFSNADPNKVIDDIKQFATCYLEKIYNSNDKVIYSFWYLRWSAYWKTILMTALTEHYKDYDTLAVELRRFYYLYWIAGKTLSQIKQTSFNVIKAIKEHKPINYIKAIFNNKIESDRIKELAVTALTSNAIDQEPWVKPLLILLEYQLTDSANPNFISLSNTLHLEHILPKKYETISGWNHITEAIKNKWLHSIANLTLLCGNKNIEASNNPFPIKMSVYTGDGITGTSKSRTTSFRISQKILDDFSNKTFDGNWNEFALRARWKWCQEQIQTLFFDLPLDEYHEPTSIV